MNIALLSEKYPPDVGGLAISAARLARLLVADGHSVQLFAPSANLETGASTRDAQGNLTIHRFGAYKRTDDTLALWFDVLLHQQRALAIDLLHGYFLPQAGFLAAFAGRYLNRPSVVSARGNDLDRAIFDPAKAAHILYALQNASAVTANTHDLVRKAQALAPGCPVMRVPNGVDAQFFCPRQTVELALPAALQGLPVIGFVGEARSKKGLAALLLAYGQLARQQPAALLLLGGVRSGEDKEMTRVFQKQNPSLPVCILPNVPYELLPDYYNLIDVLAIPSLHDGLPNALLEGMACGRAIVTTPVGGMADVIVERTNGLLVPAGDENALAAGLAELLSDGDLRRQLGQQARADVLRDFTLQQELDGYLKIYRQLATR